jgi:hypothetical protein
MKWSEQDESCKYISLRGDINADTRERSYKTAGD